MNGVYCQDQYSVRSFTRGPKLAQAVISNNRVKSIVVGIGIKSVSKDTFHYDFC